MRFRATLAIFLLSLTACSSEPTYDSSTAEGGFKVGERYEKDERFEEAIAQFAQVKNKHPYSALASEAELKIADINFKREDYVEAQSGYETFKELHPSHPKIDYVTFRLGLSFYHQLPSTIDRDLSLADKALLYFDEVLTSYPNSKYAVDAKAQKAKILNMLAEKEFYIATFYFKREKWDSALGRFEDLLQKFPHTELTARALKGAAVSAHRMKDSAKAKGYLARLESTYANSKELREAKREIGDAD
jgi:outer membrane protein assembly factor BamD